MQNILTSVENLRPGDTWNEDDIVYVIYATTPLSAGFVDLSTISVQAGVYKAQTVRLNGTTRFVTNRPE